MPTLVQRLTCTISRIEVADAVDFAIDNQLSQCGYRGTIAATQIQDHFMLEAQPQQIPTIVWLLQSGGIVPLAFGLILLLFAIVYGIWPNRTASMILVFMSMFPAIIGLGVVYSTAAEYVEMTASPVAPKPAELATLTARAMGSSFSGLLGTILPVFTAFLALARTARRVDIPKH